MTLRQTGPRFAHSEAAGLDSGAFASARHHALLRGRRQPAAPSPALGLTKDETPIQDLRPRARGSLINVIAAGFFAKGLHRVVGVPGSSYAVGLATVHLHKSIAIGQKTAAPSSVSVSDTGRFRHSSDSCFRRFRQLLLDSPFPIIWSQPTPVSQFVWCTIKLCGCFHQNALIVLFGLRLSRESRHFVFVPSLKESINDFRSRHRKLLSLIRLLWRDRLQARAT